jgi:hypothetical protein
MRTLDVAIPREFRSVPTLDCFTRLDDHIANSGIQAKSGKGSPVQSRFDGIASPAVRRGSQIHDRRSDDVVEPVTEKCVSGSLQHSLYDRVDVTNVCRWRDDQVQREVDVHG